MKNLKTGNYTEFRDISDSFYFRLGGLIFAKVSIMQNPFCPRSVISVKLGD